MFQLDDTIAAVASAPGGAARGVVRISGAQTLECLRRSFQWHEQVEPPANGRPRVYGGDLLVVAPLPCDLYVWPSARSYSRQTAAEIHTMGSQPMLELVLQTICTNGARLARPGEFTLRAFLAGRLDLTQAEAVLGTIDADDKPALRIALDQLAGGLSSPLQQLRGDLLDLLADLEAGLDFVSEDIQFVSCDQLISRLSFAAGVVDRIKEQIGGRSASQPERRVVLVGWPNTGKSTLFNALAGRDAAIASPQAGTTRDYLQTELEIGTGKCLLIDTAGFESLRDSEGIDSVARQLADRQRAIGDIVVLCLDSSRPINEWEQQQAMVRERDIVVWTKCERRRDGGLPFSAIETSAFTGAAWMNSVA